MMEEPSDLPDWRHPTDAYVAQLAAAHDALLAARTDPSAAVVLFEPIIEELMFEPANREVKLPRVRTLGRELFAELRMGRWRWRCGTTAGISCTSVSCPVQRTC